MNNESSDPAEIRFSPALLNEGNVDYFLDQAVALVPSTSLSGLRLVAGSAVAAGVATVAKTAEVLAETGKQEVTWAKFNRYPIEDEFALLRAECDGLVGKEAALRKEALSAAATCGMEVNAQDVESLASFQATIERNVFTRPEVLGSKRSADVTSKAEWWVSSIVAVSPLLLCVLTALGLVKLLSGADIQSAMFSPMLPVAIALALGITIPTLLGAYRFGWLIASMNEGKRKLIPTARTLGGMVFGAAAVVIPTVFLAAIDALAVQSLAEDMMKAASRSGAAAPVSWWVPLIGSSFMGAASFAKVWSGYCDSIASYQHDLVLSAQRKQADKLRKATAAIAQLLAQADMAAARLDQVQKRMAEIVGLLAEVKFEPQLSPELLSDLASARNCWMGESARFWAMVWEMVPDPSIRTSRAIRNGGRKFDWKSAVKNVFGRRGWR